MGMRPGPRPLPDQRERVHDRTDPASQVEGVEARSTVSLCASVEAAYFLPGDRLPVTAFADPSQRTRGAGAAARACRPAPATGRNRGPRHRVACSHGTSTAQRNRNQRSRSNAYERCVADCARHACNSCRNCVTEATTPPTRINEPIRLPDHIGRDHRAKAIHDQRDQVTLPHFPEGHGRDASHTESPTRPMTSRNNPVVQSTVKRGRSACSFSQCAITMVASRSMMTGPPSAPGAASPASAQARSRAAARAARIAFSARGASAGQRARSAGTPPGPTRPARPGPAARAAPRYRPGSPRPAPPPRPGPRRSCPGRGPPAAPATGARPAGQAPAQAGHPHRLPQQDRPGLGHQAPAVSGHRDRAAACAIVHLESAFGSATDRTLDKPYPPRSKALFLIRKIRLG